MRKRDRKAEKNKQNDIYKFVFADGIDDGSVNVGRCSYFSSSLYSSPEKSPIELVSLISLLAVETLDNGRLKIITQKSVLSFEKKMEKSELRSSSRPSTQVL